MAPALSEAGVRVEISGPAVPYAQVVYELGPQGGAVVASVVKTWAAGFGQRDRVGLLPAEVLPGLLGQLRGMGAFELRSRRRKGHRVRYTVRLRSQGRSHSFVVDDPTGRHAKVVAFVRAQVLEHAGEVPFVDEMLLPAEAGVLRVRSRPVARVEVDGRPVPGQTPVAALKLRPGRHSVRLESLDGARKNEYEVMIEVGKTTSLSVELE